MTIPFACKSLNRSAFPIRFVFANKFSIPTSLAMAVVVKSKKGNQIFEEMIRNGVKADILTYNALLLGLCNKGKTKKDVEGPVGLDSVVLSELCKGFSEVWKERLVTDMLKEVDDGFLDCRRYEKFKSIIECKEIEQNM
ncbi:hypothetical protein L2E82_39585 [Cichorium intybus]|uniref:Uncharacterized protein n=1 Tax=Cichorium intybus TaxID=13427 RepID=A0ACB9AKC9_CICIN|nr:hypothetical protein L2E82_39585 [Cichorium intybus]